MKLLHFERTVGGEEYMCVSGGGVMVEALKINIKRTTPGAFPMMHCSLLSTVTWDTVAEAGAEVYLSQTISVMATSRHGKGSKKWTNTMQTDYRQQHTNSRQATNKGAGSYDCFVFTNVMPCGWLVPSTHLDNSSFTWFMPVNKNEVADSPCIVAIWMEFLILNLGSQCKMLPVTQVLLLLWLNWEAQLHKNKKTGVGFVTSPHV